MIDPRFAILGACLTIFGSATYARATVRGRTQPNRVTWALWTLAPMIAFAAELSQGVGLESLLTFGVGFGPLLVVIASFLDPKAYARLTRFDLGCGALSLAALVGWALTGTGDVAICLSVLSDFFGALPTVRKAWRQPETENPVVFICSATGAAITLLTIRSSSWGFAGFAFPVYIVMIDVTLSVLVLSGRRAVPSGAMRVSAARRANRARES